MFRPPAALRRQPKPTAGDYSFAEFQAPSNYIHDSTLTNSAGAGLRRCFQLVAPSVSAAM